MEATLIGRREQAYSTLAGSRKRRGAGWSSFDLESTGSNPTASAFFPRRLTLEEWPSGQRR